MPGQGRRRLFLLLIALATGVLALAASSASANTVQVGAPGGGSAGGGWLNLGGSPVTVANTSLGEPGAHVTSPVTGTIVGWQVTTLGVGSYRLHVLRPSSSGRYTEEGSAPGDVTVSGPNTFSASLPIQAGDAIGVDVPAAQGIGGHVVTGSAWALFSPAFAGGTAAGPAATSSGDRELLFNAQVQYAPTPDTPPPSGGSRAGCRKAKEQKRSEKRRKKHRRAASASKKCGKKKRK